MRYSHLILDIVHSHKYKGLDVEGFKNYFHVETSEEFTQLIKDLNLLGKVIVLDAGHQGIGVSQIWRIAIKPSKYKGFKVLFDKSIFFDDIIYLYKEFI